MAVSTAEMSQFASWASALIVGGANASAVQMSTIAVRGLSAATTGGLANPVISTREGLSAFVVSILSLMVAVLLVFAWVIVLIWGLICLKRKSNDKNNRLSL